MSFAFLEPGSKAIHFFSSRFKAISFLFVMSAIKSPIILHLYLYFEGMLFLTFLFIAAITLFQRGHLEIHSAYVMLI